MRKITVCILSLAFLATGMTSCAKPTKRKLANDWTVSSYEEKTTYGSAGSEPISSEGLLMTETEITRTEYSSTPWDPNDPDYSVTETGVVHTHKLTIKKDGAWIWTQDYTYVDSVSRQHTIEQTGSWEFLGKNKKDGFKTNERIVLNVLTAHEIHYQNTNGQPAFVESEKSQTYSSGEKQLVFVITSLDEEELRLESDFTRIHKQNSAGGSQWTSLKKMILKNK